MRGKIYVVGSGPGRCDLLAVRARRALRRADRVLVAADARGAGALRAEVGGAPWVRLDARVQGSSKVGPLPKAVATSAAAGELVVWLVDGDPFARSWGAEIEHCRAAGVDLEVIPSVRGDISGTGGPLCGKRVLVTRSRHQARETCRLLEDRGAMPVCLPTLRLEPIPGALDPAVAALRENRSAYDFLVATSANAVAPLWAALERQGLDSRALAGVVLCAIGPGTARALGEIGLRPDLVPDDHRAEGVIELLSAERVAGKRVLLPRAEVAREILPETLRARGAIVDLVAVYRTVLPPAEETEEGLSALRAGAVEIVTFTSASTVENFRAIVGATAGEICERSVVAAIGPVTRDACRSAGLPVHVMPSKHTLPCLVDELVAHFGAVKR